MILDVVDEVHELIQTQPKNADGTTAVLFEPDGFLLVGFTSDQQSPQQTQRQHTHQEMKTLGMDQVGVFKVESSGFEEPKGGLN